MLEQNQEPNKEQITGEHVVEEKLDIPEEESNQPLESSENFLPSEFLFGQNQELNEEQINEKQVDYINEEQISKEKIVEEQVGQPNNEQINQHSEEQANQSGVAQINEEQIAQVAEEQVGEEKLNLPQKLNAPNEEELNQPFENNNDFSEPKFLNLPTPAPLPKKKLILIVVIVFVVILVSGGLPFAMSKIFDMKIPLAYKIFHKENFEITNTEESPQDVINKMLSSFKNIKTSREAFNLKITEENKDGEDEILNILLQGKRDLNILEYPNLDYIFIFIQPNSNVGISLAFRYIDKTMFVKLLGGSKFPFFDLSQTQNQWFYFGAREMENLKKVAADSNQVQLELNKEDQEKIFKILKEAKLFKTIQSFQGDAVNSVPVFHYLITFDAQGFLEFITKLEEVGQNSFKDQNLTVEFPKEKIHEMKKQLEKIEDMPIEIWIEKETYFLRKAAINHFETDIAKSDGAAKKADVLLTFELNKINEPVNIQAPKDGQSLGKMIQNIFGKLISQMSLLKESKL